MRTARLQFRVARQSLLAIVALVIATIALVAASAKAGQFTDSEVGYSLTLPDGWSAIPSDAIDAFFQRVINPQTPPAWRYCAGFQLSNHRRNFELPYMLVQTQSYPGGKHVESVSESELKQIVASVTGLSPADVRKAMSAEASHALQTINAPTASYVTDPPGFRMTFSITAAGAGRIHGQSVALLGKDRYVMVHFYAPQARWEEYEPTFRRIADGFHLAPEQQIALGGFNWGSVGNSAVIGGIIGAVCAPLVWLSKRVAKR